MAKAKKETLKTENEAIVAEKAPKAKKTENKTKTVKKTAPVSDKPVMKVKDKPAKVSNDTMKETKPKKQVKENTNSNVLEDIVSPTKAEPAPKKSKARKKADDSEIEAMSDEQVDKELAKAIGNLSGEKENVPSDIVSPKKDLSEEELSKEIQETVKDNKGKKGRKGGKATVSDVAKTGKEMYTLDDVKQHFLEYGKANGGTVKQDDIDKFTAHLKLTDEDFDDLLSYLTDNGLALDDEGQELEEDDLPPVYDEEDYSNDEDEDSEDEEYDEEEDMLSSVDVKNSDPVRQYLHAIGAYQVFKSKDEEVVCAQAILAGQKALEDLRPFFQDQYEEYVKKTGNDDFANFVDKQIPKTDDYLEEDFFQVLNETYPEVKPDHQIYELVQKIDYGHESENRLIQCNLKLVVSIAKHYVNRGMDFLDLIQEGNLGLMKAVDKFDYTRGFKFSTYATWWIRQAITRALADQARTIRIPVHMVETINKITRAQRKLVQKLNRDPTAEEISEELGGQWSASRIREIQQIALDPLSLEKPVGEEEDSHVGDFIEDKDNISPYEFANRSMERERINEVLGQLTDREARVIRLRYGLEDGKNHTLEEVGKEFNVTRERIRQIEAKALKKLRHPARAKLLKDFRTDF